MVTDGSYGADGRQKVFTGLRGSSESPRGIDGRKQEDTGFYTGALITE